MTAELLGDALGHHELVQVIGGGPGGLVYEAFDRRLGRQLAIKTFRLDAQDPQAADAFEERLRAGAAAAAQLQHPNIVAVYGCHRQGQTASLAMEFVEGENLAQHLARVGPLPAPKALAVVAQLVSALEMAHAHGLAHGRVEPEHLMVSPTGQLKVVGFGVPRPAVADVAGDLSGTARVAYQLFTGTSPWQQLGEAGGLRPPHQLRPDLPEALSDVFARALSDEPLVRYGSAGDLLAALRAAVESPPSARPAIRPRLVAAGQTPEAASVPVSPAAATRQTEPQRARAAGHSRGTRRPALLAASLLGVLLIGGLFLSSQFGSPGTNTAESPEGFTTAQPVSRPPVATTEPVNGRVQPASPLPTIATNQDLAPSRTVARSPAPAPAPAVARSPAPAPAVARSPAPAQVAAAPTPAPAQVAARSPALAPAAVPAPVQTQTQTQAQAEALAAAPTRAPSPATASPATASPATVEARVPQPAPARVEAQASTPAAPAPGPRADDTGTAGAGPAPRAGSPGGGAVGTAGTGPGPVERPSAATESIVIARQLPAQAPGQPAIGDPEAACRHQQLVIAREVCNIAICEETQWIDHPVCVRRHAEQRRRDQLREQAARTR